MTGGPCMDHSYAPEIVIALFSGVTMLFSAWLAHRRRRADIDRKRFYTQMRVKNRIPSETVQDIEDRVKLRRQP